jgi:hypothetical protein
MLCCHQNQDRMVTQQLNTRILKYLQRTVAYHTYFGDEVKGRINSANAWYHSTENIFSSHLSYRKVKLK